MGLDNFYLVGHSWGGLLAQEYALKYGEHLKGLVVFSMIDNIEEYTTHINKLREEMFNSLEVQYMKDVEEAENFDDPMYQELLKSSMLNMLLDIQKFHIWSIQWQQMYTIISGK